MLQINTIALHILDFNSNVMVYSDLPIDAQNVDIGKFVEKHIVKSINSNDSFESRLPDGCELKSVFIDYLADTSTFIPVSVGFAKTIQAALSGSDVGGVVDVLIVDYSLDDDRFLGLLIFENKVGFTHQVVKTSDGFRNEIIYHHAILPNPTQKIDMFALINLKTLDVQYLDKKFYINGKDISLLRDAVLKTEIGVSQKETFKLVNEVVKKVSDEYGSNTAKTISKVKKIIRDNSEISNYINPIEMGTEIFEESELMQQRYKQEMITAKAPEILKVKNNFVDRVSKKHKIKTDTGVEISIPIDYFENKDFIEFINNTNGTLSIEIKNVGKITNN